MSGPGHEIPIPDLDGSPVKGEFGPLQSGQARPANPLPGAKDVGIPSLRVPKVGAMSRPRWMSLIKRVTKLDRSYGDFTPGSEF